MARFIVGMTGASGSVYAQRLIEKLLEMDHEILITITAPGLMVVGQELNLKLGAELSEEETAFVLRERFGLERNSQRLLYYRCDNIGAPIASGSFRTDGMIVVPCTMAAVSAIAHGASNDLLERAADVMMKERKRLVLVPRETPYNTVHLKNMLFLSQNGVHIVPASPSFYHGPQTLQELVDFFVGRLMDQLGLVHNEIPRWQGMQQN